MLGVAVSSLTSPCQGLAQSAAPELKFEVASIRPHVFSGGRAGVSGRGGGNVPSVSRTPARINFQAATVEEIIAFAYGFPVNRIEGRPQWVKEDPYDISATSSSPTSLAEQKRMLQALLAERFGLVVHRASKDGPVYALVAGTKPNLTVAKESGEFEIAQFSQKFTFNKDSTMSLTFTGKHVSMTDLADWLSGPLGRPVLNKTGIEGLFDVELSGPPVQRTGETTVNASDQLMPAIRNQLGLGLESQRGLVETLVIEHIQKPSEN